jgi:carboxyl-terminal processing protease
MNLLLGGDDPSQDPERGMKRLLKPLLVTGAIIAALFLTITRPGYDGSLQIVAQRQSRAAPDRSVKDYDLTALRVFTVVLGRVKNSYVDPKRIEPKRMLLAALHGIEKNVAEVIVEELKKNKELKLRVQDVERVFDISQVDSPWALSAAMKEIVRFMRTHLNPGTNIRDVEYAAINGMLSTLDPHSVLLKPELYDEMKLSTRGQFGGLGIVISMVNGVLTVMKPMKGTPASTVGIESCDSILKIGEESTVNMTLTQAVSRLRGRPGSPVEITIDRQGWKKPQRKTLTRAIIKVDSVKSRMLDKKVGYIRLTSFQGNSYQDIREQLNVLKGKGMRSLILDLRGNPGGLLDQAVKISDLFIDSGTILTTVSHAGKQREEKRAKRDGTEARYPIAVLVSTGSASASEIVAGALKNLDRAVLIGSKTFGKGSVQVLYDMDDGSALKLTIAQYLTPGDISIQSVGITPDVMTVPMAVRKDFIHLKPNERGHTREADLRAHLTHRNTQANVKPTKTVRYVADRRAKKKKKEEKPQENLCLYPDRRCEPTTEDEFVEGFQIRFARDFLAKAKGWRRTQVLAGANEFFVKTEEAQRAKLTRELKKLGVDWSTDTAPAEGEAKLAVKVTTTPDGPINACKKVMLKVSVTNEGTKATSQLHATSKSGNAIFSGYQMVFGHIAPGETRTWEVPVEVRDAPTRVDDLTLNFNDAAGTKFPPHASRISTAGVKRPVFSYGYQLIDDIEGNLDGRAQRGEKLRLLVRVKNTGVGPALKAVTRLKNLAGLGVFIRKGRFVLGRLEAGETKTASFTLDLQKSFSMRTFKLELSVYDDGLREIITDKLKFPVADSKEAPKAAKGVARITSGEAPFVAWPEDGAPVVGYAKKGAAFKILGRYPGWYRVRASAGQPAYLAERLVTPGRQAGRSTFIPRFTVTPPRIEVKVDTHATDKEVIPLTGKASGEAGISDVFAFVRNPEAKIQARKIFYKSNRNGKTGKELTFKMDVPLAPGTNYVTIYAREREEVQAQKLLVIYRNKKPTQEKAKAGNAGVGAPGQ